MSTSVSSAIYLDQASSAEVQDIAERHEKDLKALLERVRAAVYELTPLLEGYRDVQYALEKFALFRPAQIRCPYPAIKSLEELIVVAHSRELQRAVVAVKRLSWPCRRAAGSARKP